MPKITLYLFPAFLLSFVPITPLYADVHEPATCSQSDVQGAVNAASDGDIILVPSGTCSWSGNVYLPAGKSLTLRGAGTDQTIINGRITVNTSNGKVQRITGFALDSSGTRITINDDTDANCINCFRIDNNMFPPGGLAVLVVGSTYGVIDHNLFTGGTLYNCIWVMTGAHDRGLDGGAWSWEQNTNLGGPDAVYLEDNTFNFDAINIMNTTMDGRSGARWVSRYNTYRNATFGSHDSEIAHERGTRRFEFYHNDMTFDVNIQTASYHRGGTGVIFGNRIRAHNFTEANQPLIFKLNRAFDGVVGDRDPWNHGCDNTAEKFCVGGPPASCLSDADCTGSYDGPCVPIDGQQDAYGYMCRDQLGAGKTDPVTGIQASEPIYEWDNYWCQASSAVCDPDPAADGVEFDIFMYPGVAARVTEGRDVFTDTQHPTYTPLVYPHPLTLAGGFPPPKAATNVQGTSPAE